MQLDSKEAVRLGYVRDKTGNLLPPADYNKVSSIDITIGEVLYKDKDGNITPGKHTTIRPQESLVIISNEIIHVPSDYVAYVFLKNNLSQQGLLALNTGIIDADYVGPISTVIINFSNVNADIPSGITKNEKDFFRVVFHKIDSTTTTSLSPLALPTVNFTEQDYNDYKNKKINSLKNLPKTFLEPSFLKQKIQDELFSKLSDFSMIRIGLVIGALGLCFTILPMAKDYFFNWQFDVKDAIISQKENQIKIDNLEKDIDKLKEQLHALELMPNNRNKRR